MSVAVQCPNPACGANHHVSEKALGRRARCPRCGQDFTLAATTLPDAPPAAETVHDRSSAEPPRGQTAAFELTSALPLPPAAAPQSKPADSSLPDRFGRFEIRSRIGVGATGVVYRAFDPLLGRDVAIKVPNEAALDSPQAVARFLREPKAAAQLRHPHIVPVYDAGADQGRYYIASAYIEGHTLEREIADDRPDFRRAAEIVLDLADALYYAHGLGVVHRDVKPANIMLDARGDALLMDFGLARVEAGEKLTHDGTVLGTPAYMAPEQASVELGEVGPASDQYSLGVVLYELLCGERPFHGPPAVVIFHVLNEQPRSPRAIDADVPRDLETIALKAMSKRPADRYTDCRALADDLRRWLEDRPIQARQMGPIERTVRWAKKRPALAALAATLLLSAVVSTWFAVALQRRDDDLRGALADAQAHAERVQKANEAIRDRDKSLAEREAALQTAEEQIVIAREALDDERQRVAEKDDELQRQLDENERLAKERDVARAAQETAEDTASQATKARDVIVRSETGWGLYKAKLLAAHAALREGKKAEAIAFLKACPTEHRSWEWSVMWSRSHGNPASWSWSGGDAHGEMAFKCNGKILAVHNYRAKTVTQGGRRVFVKEEFLTLLEGSTGREMDSVPWLGPNGLYAFHPDGKTIAFAAGDTKVFEHALGAGGVDTELLSTEQKHIEWIGYDPNGSHLYFVERDADNIVVRTIDRTNRQLAQVAALHSPLTRNAKNLWPPTGTFVPDGRFFLFNRGSVLNVANNNELHLPVGAAVFGEDLSIIIGHRGGGLAAVFGLVSALSEKVPVQAVACPSFGAGVPIAISPDRKRLAFINRQGHDGSVTIWNVTSSEPQLWEQVITFSDGIFSPANSLHFAGTHVVLSPDWLRLASRIPNQPDPKYPKLWTRRLQKITVESWNEPGPEAADDAEADPKAAKKPD